MDDAKTRIRPLRPLEWLPSLGEEERMVDDDVPVEDDEVVKDSDLFTPIPEDKVVK